MAVWNPWHGCHKKSEGCAHCYMFARDASVGKVSTVVRTTADFSLPVRRRRDGSYEYYISEPIVSNDAKGAAPYVMCYTEIRRLQEE